MSQVKNSNVTLAKVERKEKSFRIEVTATILKEGKSALSILNEGDARFDALSKRHAWMKVEPLAMEKYFGIPQEKLNALKVGESIELNIEAPQIAGMPLNIEIVENHVAADDYQLQNWEKTAKQVKVSENVLKSTKMKKSSGIYDALNEQGYFVSNGKLVFSHATVVTGEPNHQFVDETVLVTLEEARVIVASGVVLAKPEAVEAKETKKETAEI